MAATAAMDNSAWLTTVTESTFQTGIQICAAIGALFVLSVFKDLFPRFRIGLDPLQTAKPFQVCILSSDSGNPILASLVQRFQGNVTQELRKAGDDVDKNGGENVVVIASGDLHTTTSLVKQAISSHRSNNVVLVEMIKRDSEETRKDPTDPHAVIDRLCEYGTHHYLKRLVQGLSPEYPQSRIRLCTVDHEVINDPAVAEEMEEFIRIPSVSYVRINRKELMRPKVYRLHLILLVLAFVLFIVFSSPYLSMMDPTTFRPKKGFDPTLKAIAVATNIPIKLGIVHGLLYMFEFFLDPEMFKRHVGQRLTTLWFQLFQFQRFGQHLQMHIETLWQAADVLNANSPLARHRVVRVFLWIVIAGLLTQNALTSLGWHSLQEQAIGFGLGMIKLVFDLSAGGSRVNRYVGESLARGIQWLGAAISLGGGLFLNDFAPLHPTAMASLIVAGGALTLLVLFGVRGGWRAGGLSRLADL